MIDIEVEGSSNILTLFFGGQIILLHLTYITRTNEFILRCTLQVIELLNLSQLFVVTGMISWLTITAVATHLFTISNCIT